MASSSSLSLSFPSSSLSPNWEHDVFPSFHGPDVRTTFLSHTLKEFRNKGIDTFIDNGIKRGESIGPELKRAIRGSKIAIVLFSEKYASSSWCLDELVEIMNCREELGQTVMTIFYKVYPTDVKKQIGDFGKVFKETCQGKTEKKIETWTKALEGVATIAGYHSIKWDDEAVMIEEIAADISIKLNIATPSRDFDRFIGMGAHMERLKPFLRLDLVDDVRMIGIWGPPGIGKSTIARCLFNQFSSSFQLSAIMVNIKGSYPRPCLDEGTEQLKLQGQMLSQLLNHKDMVITHLGVAKERLKGKKVFLVLDDVDRLAQLVALAEKTQWFGLGSRIVITTEDQRVLKAHQIKDIYKVDYPRPNEAFKMFCKYAFGQEYPKDGFTELAWEVTQLVGNLPLGLQVMGSHFRGMSKDEWIKKLPRLRSCLDSKIESILKFSYDALDDADKDIFLHIACFFSYEKIEKVVAHLEKRFPNVREGLVVLHEKSLISMEKVDIYTRRKYLKMHDLLVQLGRDIDRKQHRFLELKELEDITEELSDDAAARRSVIGISMPKYKRKSNDGHLQFSKLDGSDRQCLRVDRSNLQFLKVDRYLSHGLSYLPPKIRLLHWKYFPMTCLPSPVNVEFLVELNMPESKLEKLWKGNKSLRNLKWMDLSFSNNLKELPDLSTASSLKELILHGCKSLVKLSFSIGNANNLQKLDLRDCSSLLELPSIRNATNLQKLNLSGCSSLVELPSSIGNATNLQKLDLKSCSSLVKLPFSIGNVIKNTKAHLLFRGSTGNAIQLNGCLSLVKLPSSIGNATNLQELDFSGCSSLVEVPASVGNLHNLEFFLLKGCTKLEVLPVNVNLKSLDILDLSGCSSLKVFPEISTNITYLELDGTAIEEVPSSIRTWYRLSKLIVKGCKKLVSLPQLPKSILYLNARNCESLERLDCSFRKFDMHLNFASCFKLNKDARDVIIQTSSKFNRTQVLPGKKIPICFTHRANGSSLILKLNERHFPSTLQFKACILLGIKNDIEDEHGYYGDFEIMVKHSSGKVLDRQQIGYSLKEHLYIFDFEAHVTSHDHAFEISFEISIRSDEWVIKECGVNYGDCEAEEETNERDSDCEAEKETNEGDNAKTKKIKNGPKWRYFGCY